MSDLRFLLKVSRPRFWFYVFGPYIVGLVASAASTNELLNWRTGLFALYFLFPANLLIYGINDVFDYETDKVNKKKVEYETLVDRDRHKTIALWILFLNIPFLIIAVIVVPATIPSLAGFLFFSVFYSASPIRAKAIPFLDSAFNILYIFPGAFGYQLLSGNFPPIALMFAAGLWTAAMHAYSAIPDIEADRAAGLKTIATVLGPLRTLIACALLYITAAFLASEHLGFVSFSLGAVYVILMLASIRSLKTGTLFKLYRAFPLINVMAGFIIFWQIALEKLF
ncbi:MAG: prenyltransferase [Pyrinomonadaceae bacterium]